MSQLIRKEVNTWKLVLRSMHSIYFGEICFMQFITTLSSPVWEVFIFVFHFFRRQKYSSNMTNWIFSNSNELKMILIPSFFASAAGILRRFRYALKPPKVFHLKGFIVVALFFQFTYLSAWLFALSHNIAILWSDNFVGDHGIYR